MKITITIECIEDEEILTHLSVIRQQVRKEIKRQKYFLQEKAVLTDNNCYGYHKVTIHPLQP